MSPQSGFVYATLFILRMFTFRHKQKFFKESAKDELLANPCKRTFTVVSKLSTVLFFAVIVQKNTHTHTHLKPTVFKPRLFHPCTPPAVHLLTDTNTRMHARKVSQAGAWLSA